MNKKDITAAVVDNVLVFAVTSSALAVGIFIPNLLVGLEKPLNVLWKQMDKRAREREMRRVVSYMKSNNLLEGNYEHGLRLTKKGQQRLAKSKIDTIKIEIMLKWDGHWRLVIYDIPESQKQGRNALVSKLTKLGFYQLQRSAWIHPFPCREEITELATYYGVNSYVGYLEILTIDNQEALIKRFKKRYPSSIFKQNML